MIACPSELDWIFLEIGTLPCSSGRQKGSCVPLVSEDAELHAKSGKGLSICACVSTVLPEYVNLHYTATGLSLGRRVLGVCV